MKKKLTNIQVILIVGTTIKILGLIYKVLLTRILTIEGMRIMSFVFPTLSLVLCLSSLSMQTVVNQNISAQLNSSKTILKSAFRITFISSSIISIFLLFSFPLYKIIYQNTFIYYPLLICIPLVYLSNTSGLFKGYLEANNNFKTPYFSNLYEQIAKFSVTFLLLLLFRNQSLEFQVFLCFFSLMLSEVVSFTYLLVKVKKKHRFAYKMIHTNGYEKSILKQALPLTLEQLAVTITGYLEPLIFYYAMGLRGMTIYESTLYYTKVCSYAIPLLLFAQFGVYSITKYAFPKITRNQGKKELHTILSKAFFLSFIIAACNLVISLFYAKETLQLMYKDSSAYPIVEKLAIFYLLSYFNPLLICILQSYKQEKKLLISSIASYSITLGLVFLLTYLYGETGFLLSILIGNFIKFSLLLFFANRAVHFKPNLKRILPLFCVIGVYVGMNYFHKSLFAFITSTLLCGLLALLLFYLFYNKNRKFSYVKMHK
ncbi:MAG: oligosaccharide flippase family protein [Anaeroplasmataceae bacterium]|nr:oligosaccharide flippase family protein [Anaeroplasmataceae bacterium]